MNLKPMRSKLIFTLVLASAALTACASEVSNPDEVKEVIYNSISGRVGVDGPILAVKITPRHA